MRIILLSIAFLFLAFSAQSQVLKSAGVWYFLDVDSMTARPAVLPNGTELAYVVGTKKIYYWHRGTSTWTEYGSGSTFSRDSIYFDSSIVGSGTVSDPWGVDSTLFATISGVGDSIAAAVANYFPLQGGTLTGTGGNGFVRFPLQSSPPSTPSTGFSLFAGSTGNNISWMQPGGFFRRVVSPVTGTPRQYQFMARSYTLADSADVAALPTGTGTTNYYAKWSSTNALGIGNLFDNNTVVSILNNKPLSLGQWTTAGRPSGTTGYTGYNTTTAFTEGYFTSQWENYITSTGAANGQVSIFSSAGKAYGTNNLFWNNTDGRLGINTNASGGYDLDILRSTNQYVAARIGTSNGGNVARADLILQASTNSSSITGFIKFGTSNPSYKIINASDGGLYNSAIIGDLFLYNDYSLGKIKFGTGATSTAQMTLAATGNLLLGTTTDVTGYLLNMVGTGAMSLPRGTVAQRPTIASSTTPFRYNTDSTALEYGESVGTWRQLATRAYARSFATPADSLEKNSNVLYVSKNGNNSTAKRNNPRLSYLTIKAAVNASQKGDLIYIYPGTYNEGGNTLGRDSINFYCSPGAVVSNAVITDDYGGNDMDNGGYIRWMGSGVFDSCTVSIQHMNMKYHIEGDSMNMYFIPFWKLTNYNDVSLNFKFRSVKTINDQILFIPGTSTELVYTRLNILLEIDKVFTDKTTRTYPLIHFGNGAGGTNTDAKAKLVDCNLIFNIKNIQINASNVDPSTPRFRGLVFGNAAVAGRTHFQRSNFVFNSDVINQSGITSSTYETPFQGLGDSHMLFGLGAFKLDSSAMNFNVKSIVSDVHAFRIAEFWPGSKGSVSINVNAYTKNLATFHVIELGSGATGDSTLIINVDGNYKSDKEVISCYDTPPIEKIRWQGNYTSFADKAVFAIKSDSFLIENAVLKNNGTTADIYAAEARTIKVASAFADGLNISSNVNAVSLENIGSPKLETYYNLTSTSSPQTLSSTHSDNLINQGGTQATFTLNMPANPTDGQVCTITYNNAITTLTIDGNGETIVGSAVITGVPGSQRKFKFYAGIGWIKIY